MLPAALPHNLRHVKRLRLALAGPEDAVAARIAIEDGLGSADFGDYGRLIYVRRLVLPAMAPRFTGPAAARALEKSFRALLPRAVFAGDARAREAPIVWFTDVIEAFVEALCERVAERPLAAWFWHRVHPTLFATPEPAIADVFAALLALEPARAGRSAPAEALARRWARWSEGEFTRFVAALPEEPEPGAPAGPSQAGRPTHIYGVPAPLRLPAPDARERIHIAARISVPKARWVARRELLAAGLVPIDASVETQETIAAAVLARIEAAALCEPAADRSVVGADAVAPTPVRHAPRWDAEDVEPMVAQAAPVTELPARPMPVPASPELALELPPWLADAHESAYAGFCMLINAAHAVGWGEWLDGLDAAARVPLRERWLATWARRLELTPEDPHRLLWEPREVEHGADLDAQLAPWIRNMRRWLRTRARIGPASLVCRGGRVAVTRTHVDVVMPLERVDLRVRRAGLDSDPGWVPWLGKIVAFHYVDSIPDGC